MAYGAANKVQFHEITAGSPDTISTTPDLSCTAIIGTTVDGLISKKSTTWDFEIDQYDDTLLTALETLVTATEPSETTAEKYESGVESSAGSASASSSVTRSVMIKYGGDLSATHMHVGVAAGYVSNTSWGHTTKWEEVTKPTLQYITVKQAAGNAITLAAGVWDAAIVQTTTPTPALPTSIAAATYGADYALEKA